MHDREVFLVHIVSKKLLESSLKVVLVHLHLKTQFKDDPKCKSRQNHHANIKPIMHYVDNRFKVKHK